MNKELSFCNKGEEYTEYFCGNPPPFNHIAINTWKNEGEHKINKYVNVTSARLTKNYIRKYKQNMIGGGLNTDGPGTEYEKTIGSARGYLTDWEV